MDIYQKNVLDMLYNSMVGKETHICGLQALKTLKSLHKICKKI